MRALDEGGKEQRRQRLFRRTGQVSSFTPSPSLHQTRATLTKQRNSQKSLYGEGTDGAGPSREKAPEAFLSINNLLSMWERGRKGLDAGLASGHFLRGFTLLAHPKVHGGKCILLSLPPVHLFPKPRQATDLRGAPLQAGQ